MNNRYPLVLVGALLVLAVSCTAPEQEAEQVLPNVLLIITDDQGYGDVGFHGNEMIETPSLDSLANSSVNFSRFYVSPVCAPTRASLLTGRYHLSTGVSWVTHRKEVMRADEVTVAEFLKSRGYRTGLFGKWHNGKQFPHDPTGQGFDEFLGFTEGHFNNYFNAKLTRGREEVSTTGYLPDVLTDSAIQFMQGEKPWFAMLAYNTPHGPFQVPDQYFDKYKKKGLDDRLACIYGMVENIDDNVGKLLGALEENGLSKKTMVIFMTDNGPNGRRFNGGFKGVKGHVDEGGVRVPFLLKHPEKSWNDGRQIEQLAAHIDVLPTIIELIDSTYQSPNPIHGQSLVALIDGDTTNFSNRTFYTHQVSRDIADKPGAVREGNFVLTIKEEGLALYNLASDPFQRFNLINLNQPTRDRLVPLYGHWIAESLKTLDSPPLIETGHPQVKLVEFPAQEVALKDYVDFAGGHGWANDYLTNFTDQSAAIWRTKTVADAYYDVKLEINYQEGTAITLSIDQQVFTRTLRESKPKVKIESPDRAPRGGVYEFRWPSISMGAARLTPGEHQIILTVNNPQEFELKSLKLIKL